MIRKPRRRRNIDKKNEITVTELLPLRNRGDVMIFLSEHKKIIQRMEATNEELYEIPEWEAYVREFQQNISNLEFSLVMSGWR